MELNEGITEYTGLMVSGIGNSEVPSHFINNINAFLTEKSFVRSFAYETIPVYGYLLSKQNPAWHRQVNAGSDLTALFSLAFHYKAPGHGSCL